VIQADLKFMCVIRAEIKISKDATRMSKLAQLKHGTNFSTFYPTLCSLLIAKVAGAARSCKQEEASAEPTV